MKRILIIDDEEAFARNVVKPFLEETGWYEVRVLLSGIRALDACRDYKPDLILVDVMMRDMAGPQVVQNFETDKDLRRIPLIYLTATHVAQKSAESIYDGEMNGKPLLAKPIELKRLLECVEQEIGI